MSDRNRSVPNFEPAVGMREFLDATLKDYHIVMSVMTDVGHGAVEIPESTDLAKIEAHVENRSVTDGTPVVLITGGSRTCKATRRIINNHFTSNNGNI